MSIFTNPAFATLDLNDNSSKKQSGASTYRERLNKLAEAEAKAKADADAYAYWGDFMGKGENADVDALGELMLERLIISLTDFLRATCEIPLITMTTRGAKTYINPEMKAAWEKLIENEESFTAQEAEYLDIHTRDKLTKLEYDLWNCPHDMATRSKDKGQTMPYLTRAKFGRLLRIFMMLDPDLAHKRLNGILQNPELLILDPFTSERFKHPIPRTSLSATADPNLVEIGATVAKKYFERRTEILRTRRREAIAAGELSESTKAAERARNEELADMDMMNAIMNQSAQLQTTMMLQAAQNTSMMNVASAIAAGAAEQARATRNAMACQNWGNF